MDSIVKFSPQLTWILPLAAFIAAGVILYIERNIANILLALGLVGLAIFNFLVVNFGFGVTYDDNNIIGDTWGVLTFYQSFALRLISYALIALGLVVKAVGYCRNTNKAKPEQD